MSSKIIRFPGMKPSAGNPNPGDPKQPSPPTYQEATPRQNPVLPPGPAPDPAAADIGRVAVRAPIKELPEQVVKAMGILQAAVDGQMSVVVLGIKPTDSGADFYTAIHGNDSDLRNALDHLYGVVQRAYEKKGIIS